MRTLLRLARYGMAQKVLFFGTAIVTAAAIVPRVAVPRLSGNAIDEGLAGGLTAQLLQVVGAIVLAGGFRAVLGYAALYLAEKNAETCSRGSRASASASTTVRGRGT